MTGGTITASANNIQVFQVFVKNYIQVCQVLKWFSSTFSSTKNQFKYNQVFQVSAGHLAHSFYLIEILDVNFIHVDYKDMLDDLF